MSTVNRRHEIFIKEMILHGDQQKAYQVAYPKASPETARKNAYKLLQIATISDKINRVREENEEAALRAHKEAIINEATRKALSAIEKREQLRKIITGEITEEVLFPSMGKVLKVTRQPSIADRIRAIDLDNKMAGHYAPTQLKHEASGDVVIELIKAISGKK